MTRTQRKRVLTRESWERFPDEVRLEAGGRRYLVRRSTHVTSFGVSEWLHLLCEVELAPDDAPASCRTMQRPADEAELPVEDIEAYATFG